MTESDERENDVLKEGIALRKDGNIDGAFKAFNMVLEFNPKSAVAYREIAITLQITGERDKAMDAYKKALEIDPTFRMKKTDRVERKEKKVAEGFRVSDSMATSLFSVQLGSTAKDAAELMLKRNISSVAVREGGEIIGIVTERDFVRNHYFISGKDFAEIPIKTMVAYPLVTISADASLEGASNRMAEHGIRHLLVREGNDIVGLISLRDIVKAYFKFL